MGAAIHESSVFFVGEAGMGKTHLLEAAQAESDIAAVLLRINPAEAAWPLSGFSAMLSSINDSRAVEFGGRFVLRSTAPEHMFAAARDLLILVRGLGLAPMLLLIDDIDLMDHESQVLVGFMASRLGGTGVRLVATAGRLDPTGPFAGLPHEIIGPLDPAEALELAAEVARPPADESTLAIVVSQSDGNPRALVEYLADVGAEVLVGDQPVPLPLVPGRTAAALAQRAVQHLGRAQRTMLDRLSTAPLSLRAVATAGSVSGEDAVHELILSGLVDVRGPFITVRSHLLRSQLYWSMSGKSRREHHARAAEAYQGVDERLALWHVTQGEREGAPATSLMPAAVLLAREGHVAAAVEFAESARRRREAAPEQAVALSDLAEALFLRGELALAARYVEAGLGAARSSVTSLGLATLRTRVEFMRTQRVPDLDFEAWASAHSSDHPRLSAGLLATAGLCTALRWETDRARSLLDQAYAVLPPASRPPLRFLDAAARLIDSTNARPAVTAQRVTVRHSSHRAAVDLIVEGRTASLAEDYERARRLFSIVLAHRPIAQPLWLDSARYLLADNEIRAGHVALAAMAITEWRWSRTTGSSLAAHSYLDAWLSYANGRASDAHALITEGLGRATHEDNPAATACLLTLKGELCLIEADPDEASRLLGLADRVAARFLNPALVRHSADYITASALSGNTAHAAVALRTFEQRAAAHPSRWAELALARSRAVLADDENALAILDAAIASCTSSDSGLEVGRLHIARAARLERMGAVAEARAALATARSILDGAGATAWLQYTDGLLGLEPPAEPPALLRHLTEEESRIVELVRQGLRNKEIATRLYISVRTVELRLTHIYRKVGARSRSHLVSLMS